MTEPTRMQRRRRSGRGRPRSTPTPLAPPRDAGITLEPVGIRRRGLIGTWAWPVLGITALFIVAGIALSQVAPGRIGPITFPAVIRTVLPVAANGDAAVSEPTPYFASFRGVRLRLPIAPHDITAIAFHQASFPEALQVTSLVADRNLAEAAQAAARKRAARTAPPQAAPAAAASATPAAASAQGSVAAAVPVSRDDGVWTGKVLSLWRSGRSTRPSTAIDCGARPGTPVFSPVDGTVMQIKSYKLYGKYPDFEIHIKPDSWSDVDVIILHTTDPFVEEGVHVIAGVDPISRVRSLASKMTGVQLAEYTAEGGNHTHVQLNRILKPGLPWVLGQDSPGAIKRGP
jgi:hypothetical protein